MFDLNYTNKYNGNYEKYNSDSLKKLNEDMQNKLSLSSPASSPKKKKVSFHPQVSVMFYNKQDGGIVSTKNAKLN